MDTEEEHTNPYEARSLIVDEVRSRTPWSGDKVIRIYLFAHLFVVMSTAFITLCHTGAIHPQSLPGVIAPLLLLVVNLGMWILLASPLVCLVFLIQACTSNPQRLWSFAAEARLGMCHMLALMPLVQ